MRTGFCVWQAGWAYVLVDRLFKIKEESIAKRKPYYALTIDFGSNDNYFIIDENTFKLFLELLKNSNEEE
jgi:hypothetical protein